MIRRRYLRSLGAGAIVPLLLLLKAQSVAAQRGSATCQSGWDWARTRLNDSPCQVASKLLSLCESSSSSSDTFTLPSGGLYTPSSSSNIKPNTCACNVVMYNLLSACQACQASPSSNTTPELVDWQTYAAACPICSFEGGIVPGPCGPMNSIGFPNSVKPAEGEERIAIPNWAYYNSSGGAWSENGARGSGSGDKVTLSPAAAATPTSISPSSSKNDNDSTSRSSSRNGHDHDGPAPMGIGMKAAVISCSILAGIIAIVFGTYLFQLCLRQRHSKQLKKFSDESFEKVVPTSLTKTQPQRPKLLAFKNVMSRLTLAPKTPHARTSANLQPGTPRTPGVPKTPKTPRTAFLRHFPFVPFSPKRETGRGDLPTTPTPPKDYSSIAKSGESREKLLPPEGKLDRLLASAASSRRSVASSYYSDFDSYKPSSTASAGKLDRSNSVNSATASLETMKTGSVKAKKPIEGGTPSSQYLGVPTAGSSHGSSSVRLSETPSIVVSSSETEGDEVARPATPKAIRIKSQVAQVSRWSDSTGENNGLGSAAAAHSWSRVPSMHSEGRSSTSSTRSKKDSKKSVSASLHQGEFTKSPTTDLAETLMTPAQQRMMMHEDGDREEEEENLDNRASRASNSSNSSLTSMLRRLDQLDFGDTASNPATPRKVRFSTKSSKSVRVPPSPSGSSVGFAM